MTLFFWMACVGWRSSLVIAATLGATAVLSGAQVSRVKLATLVPKGTAIHRTLQAMGETWKAAPDGGVVLTMFTDGAMGSDGDMVRRMRVGQLHAGLLTAAGLAEIAPDVASIQNIPLLFRSLDEAAWVRDQLAPRFAQQIAAKGFIVLGWCDSGWWRIFSTQSLRTPDDLRGEKLNIGTDNPGRAAFVRALGLEPVSILPTEILSGLQTGLITVTPLPPIYALSAQLFTAAPHLLEVNWAPLFGGIVMHQKIWDGLTPAQQDVVRISTGAACREITTNARREMSESLAAMQERGLQVQVVEDGSEPAWNAFSDEARRQARGTLVPEAIVDEIVALIADYRNGVEPTGGPERSEP